MELIANGKHIETALLKYQFTQGERYSDWITIRVPKVNNGVDLQNCTFIVRGRNAEGTQAEDVLRKHVEEDTDWIRLDWQVSGRMTAVGGKLLLELVGTRSDLLTIKFQMDAVWVKPAAMGTGLPELNLIEEKLAEMNALLAEAKQGLVDPTLTKSEKAADSLIVGQKFLEMTGNMTTILDIAMQAQRSAANALPKSGGTMTGPIAYHTAAGSEGTPGYAIGILEISCAGAAMDGPILVDIGRSFDAVETHLSILFTANAGDAEPQPYQFTAQGMGGTPAAAYLWRTGTGTWRLYVRKLHADQKIYVHRFTNDTGAGISYADVQIASIQEIPGSVTATVVS